MFLRTFLTFMVCVLVGCGGNEQPIIDNSGQAIFSQLLAPFSIQVQETLTLQINATDPDGDELIYTWIARNSKGDDVTNTVFIIKTSNQENEGEEVEQPSTSQGPLVRFTTNKAGTYLVTVTIDDGNDKSIIESTIIEVVGVNRPPVLDGTDSIIISPGPPHRIAQEIFLTAQASDADGDRLIYEWTAKDGNNQDAQHILEEGTGPSIKFTTDISGAYLVSVVVRDGEAGQDSAAVVVVIQP
jgi:hypothetical protein